MLKGISRYISPDLMKMMMEMGHGDDLVIADGNFPSTSTAKRVVRADGQGIPELLDAILHFYPLDNFVPCPVTLMQVVAGHNYQPTIWEVYRKTIINFEALFSEFEYLERQEFYDRARLAYGVVATSEMSLYGNIILKKGIITK